MMEVRQVSSIGSSPRAAGGVSPPATPQGTGVFLPTTDVGISQVCFNKIIPDDPSCCINTNAENVNQQKAFSREEIIAFGGIPESH
jgi:hypothetical protein